VWFCVGWLLATDRNKKVVIGQLRSIQIHAVAVEANNLTCKAVPLLRRLVADLSPRWRWSSSTPVHVGFVVDKVGLVFSECFRFPLS
jgi:hypothetical protein